ncbi:MAG TPA: dihydrolipoyl dehydrogenase [bacterium]|nr:dihydrolipoyl dehydrogenase [bacterium]
MECDICILGAGPAGYTGALRAAREGKRVALIERDRVGGTCLNRGCIPSKALRRCADAFLEAAGAARFGVKLPGEPSFDYTRAAAYRDEVTEKLVAGVASLLKARRIELVSGEGRVDGPGRVAVLAGDGAVEIKCGHVVIATGSRPADLPGIRIDEEMVLSSEGALKLGHVPEKLIVIGGGVIGCEWADLMSCLGSEVTVVEALPRILLTEDRATARAVQKNLEARGVNFHLGATVAELTAAEGGVRCVLAGGGKLDADRVIVSVGRRPVTEGLGLSEAGVAIERGAIKVDEGGRTGVAGVWAAGDVIGPPMLAHAASHEMEVVIDNILGRGRFFDRAAVPAVVFVRPEVASVGLLEDAARERGIAVEVGRFAYAASGKALCMGESEGFAKAVVDKHSGLILGGTVMGAHAGDLIHELAIAVKRKIKVEDFIEIIHAHPTLSEIVLEAVADARGMAVHKAGRKRGVERE